MSPGPRQAPQGRASLPRSVRFLAPLDEGFEAVVVVGQSLGEGEEFGAGVFRAGDTHLDPVAVDRDAGGQVGEPAVEGVHGDRDADPGAAGLAERGPHLVALEELIEAIHEPRHGRRVGLADAVDVGAHEDQAAGAALTMPNGQRSLAAAHDGRGRIPSRCVAFSRALVSADLDEVDASELASDDLHHRPLSADRGRAGY